MNTSGDMPPQEAGRAGQRALVFTGDFIDRASAERLVEISEAIGVLLGEGIQGQLIDGFSDTAVGDVEIEPHPVLVSRDDFVEFGIENGYSKIRSSRAWMAATVVRQERELLPGEVDPYPRTRTFKGQGGELERFIDLLSVAERLKASNFRQDAWGIRGKHVEFLAHLVREKVGPTIFGDDA